MFEQQAVDGEQSFSQRGGTFLTRGIHTCCIESRITVWCALRSGGVIGSYSLEDGNDSTVTVIPKRYARMRTNFFLALN